MKTFVSYLLLCLTSFGLAQNSEEYFVASANSYLQNQTGEALEFIEQGLEEFPDDKKLQELKKKIEEQEQNESEQGENNQGEERDEDGEENPEDNDSMQKSGDPDGRNQGESGTGSSDEDPMNAPGNEDSDNVQDQGKRLLNQRYENILKALQNQEQEIQRRLLMGEAKRRMGRKQKDW